MTLSANITICASDVGRSILMCEFKKSLILFVKKGSLPWGGRLSIEIHRFNWHFQLRSDYFFLPQNSTTVLFSIFTTFMVRAV